MAFCAFSHPPLPLVQDSRTRWLRARRCPGEDRDVSLSHRARRQWDEITQATNTLAPSRRFFQTSKPHEGFHWGLPREAELPAETQPGERGASIWQFGQVPASCRRGGVCAPLAQRPALRFGAKCHVGITGVCSHPEPLKTGAPRNRSSEASASACVCVHRVACKCLCKVHTYGYLGTGCACTRVCEC